MPTFPETQCNCWCGGHTTWTRARYCPIQPTPVEESRSVQSSKKSQPGGAGVDRQPTLPQWACVAPLCGEAVKVVWILRPWGCACERSVLAGGARTRPLDALVVMRLVAAEAALARLSELRAPAAAVPGPSIGGSRSKSKSWRCGPGSPWRRAASPRRWPS